MTLKVVGGILGLIVTTAAVGGLVDAWVDGKVDRKIGPVVADVRRLDERIDSLVRAQEWAAYKELLAARATLVRKRELPGGLSPGERYELDQIENEIELMRQRLKAK